METTNKIACPRCGQDYIVRAVIKPLNLEIKICPECEAFWFTNEDVNERNFGDLGSYLENTGYTWDWNLLEIIYS